MKKIFTGVIAAFCLLSSAAALSWGGLVDNNTKLSANHDFSALMLNQSNGVYLSVNSNLNESGSLRFSGEGLYKYKFNFDLKENEGKLKNIADLDLFKLAGGWTISGGLLSLNLGRFKYSDFSGAVFTQTSDGLYLSYETVNIKTAVYAGYTGLLNRLNVSMVENEYKDDDQFYALCPKYVPVLADFTYKGLFNYHNAGLQFASYIPVTDDNNMKLYGTFVMNGYLGTLASYDARFTMGSEKVEDKFDGLMIDGKLDLNFFASSNIMITAGGEYVSGAQADGDIKPFMTLTSRSFGSAPVYNGVIVPKIGLMYAADKLYANLTERIIIAMPEDEAKLDGFDTSVNVVYNLFSDLQIGCDIGAYICKEVEEMSSFYATAKASLAF